MKRIVFMLATCIASVALAHTREEKIAVARYLVHCIATAPDANDCLDEGASGTVPVTYPTYESLFEENVVEGHVGCGWSSAEKQEAFESFLLDVPVLAQTNLTYDLRFYVETALTFADERQATNVLDFAKSILASPCRVGDSSAQQIFISRIVPSLEMNDFVELAITNRADSFVAEYMASDYAWMLLQSMRDLDRSVVTNGARMLLRVRQKDLAARMLDRLLVQAYPDYSVSSNRLALSDWALQNLVDDTMFSDKKLRPYFDSITNQLHQAAQPLPEVEGL